MKIMLENGHENMQCNRRNGSIFEYFAFLKIKKIYKNFSFLFVCNKVCKKFQKKNFGLKEEEEEAAEESSYNSSLIILTCGRG